MLNKNFSFKPQKTKYHDASYALSNNFVGFLMS